MKELKNWDGESLEVLKKEGYTYLKRIESYEK